MTYRQPLQRVWCSEHGVQWNRRCNVCCEAENTILGELAMMSNVQSKPRKAFRDFSDMEEISPRMSNFDYSIDAGMEEQLRAKPGAVYSRHAAWNFNAKVWFEGGKFHSEVWCYGAPHETLTADSLPELMEMANDKYGSE